MFVRGRFYPKSCILSLPPALQLGEGGLERVGVVGNQALQDGVRSLGLPLLVQQASMQQQPFGAFGQVGLARERLQPAQGARPLLAAFGMAQQRLQGRRVQRVQLLQLAQQVGGVGCLRVVAAPSAP
jgi:hypothetical protein